MQGLSKLVEPKIFLTRILVEPATASAGTAISIVTSLPSVPVEFCKAVGTWYTSPASSSIPFWFQSMNTTKLFLKFPDVFPCNLIVYVFPAETFPVILIKSWCPSVLEVAAGVTLLIPAKFTNVIGSVLEVKFSGPQYGANGFAIVVKLNTVQPVAAPTLFLGTTFQ